MLSSEQIRAARALIRWDQIHLAEEAGVSVETIKRLEKIKGPLLTATGTTLAKIEHALRNAGVIFLADGETAAGGPGVRLKG